MEQNRKAANDLSKREREKERHNIVATSNCDVSVVQKTTNRSNIWRHGNNTFERQWQQKVGPIGRSATHGPYQSKIRIETQRVISRVKFAKKNSKVTQIIHKSRPNFYESRPKVYESHPKNCQNAWNERSRVHPRRPGRMPNGQCLLGTL